MRCRSFFQAWRTLNLKLFSEQHHTNAPCPFLSRWCSNVCARETVFALSSGHGRCGVAVVRLTGPQSLNVLKRVAKLRSTPRPRTALFRKLYDPETSSLIDHGLVLWFPGPHSFTGEDSVEFQVHGGQAVVLALLETLGCQPGLRPAEPGEFTKRAFFSGKLDLTEVEGLADLIHAETEAQRKQALRQMEGELGKLYEHWRKSLIHCVANVEAVIDFGEDENIEHGVLDQVRGEVRSLLEGMEAHLDDRRKGERLRSGVHLAIVGPPNAGKSSLLNVLCQRPAAIVSPYPGTTRDILESALDISGYPVIVSDTAGVRCAVDPVEKEGVQRAVSKAKSSDLKIVVFDVSLLKDQLRDAELNKSVLDSQMNSFLESLGDDSFSEEDTVVVMNKKDLLQSTPGALPKCMRESLCFVSCKTGEGVDAFLTLLKKHLERLCGDPLSGSPSITQTRYRRHLCDCTGHLRQFLSESDSEERMDIAADQLRLAIRQLGKITGRVDIEDILGVVFSSFCIGK